MACKKIVECFINKKTKTLRRNPWPSAGRMPLQAPAAPVDGRLLHLLRRGLWLRQHFRPRRRRLRLRWLLPLRTLLRLTFDDGGRS